MTTGKLILKKVVFYEIAFVDGMEDREYSQEELKALFEENGMDDTSDYLEEPEYSVRSPKW